MPSIEPLLFFGVLGLDTFGPTMILLLVRYRSGSWKRAFRAGLIFATVGAFLITGLLALVLKFPASWNLSSYWFGGFWALGASGVMIACASLVWQFPLVGYWIVIATAEARRRDS